jgi:release factor glutamine methyltransferase
MNINEALMAGYALLKDAGVEGFFLDARLLLAEVLGAKAAPLLPRANEPLSPPDWDAYQTLLTRRADREPVAYITNRKAFRYLDLYVDGNVLIPRPETETLVEAAIAHIDRMRERQSEICALDLCTGSGAVAFALKQERPFINMHASDVSEAALAVAERNAEKHNLRDGICFIRSDLFDNIAPRFNIIVSNPPYVPREAILSLQTEVRREPLLALDGGRDGVEIIRRIINEAPLHLAEGGILLLEAAPEQMDKITLMLIAAGFSRVEITKDLAGKNRVIGTCDGRGV